MRKMKYVTLCFAAALAAGLNATPVIAQNAGDAFANAPLSFVQEQIVSEVRNRDRKEFVSSASEYHRLGHWFVKPIADWTQSDFTRTRFRTRYDERVAVRGLKSRGKSKNMSEIYSLIFWERLLEDSGGDDGDGAN